MVVNVLIFSSRVNMNSGSSIRVLQFLRTRAFSLCLYESSIQIIKVTYKYSEFEQVSSKASERLRVFRWMHSTLPLILQMGESYSC